MKKIFTITFISFQILVYSQTNNDSIILKKYLAKIDSSNIKHAIPYVFNDKWGWLDRRTSQALTLPVFEYTDFHTNKTLLFVYKSENYKYDTTDSSIQHGGIILACGSMPFEQKRDSSTSGFMINKYGNIVTISNKLKNVEKISENKSIEILGIATDSLNRKGIITADGGVFNNFGFEFSDIKSFWGKEDKTFFLAKKLSDKEYKIYDRDGNAAPINGITGYRFFSSYEYYKDNLAFIGWPDYFIIELKSTTENILNKITLKPIFQKKYKKVLTISGTTNDNDKGGNGNNKGINEYFFLVTDGVSTFYVDSLGKEYKIRKYRR